MFTIVADDLGISASRDLGIFQAIISGVVTNTVLLPNGPTSLPAIQLFKQHKLLDRVGLHLNLTEGKPLTVANRINSILLKSDQIQEGTNQISNDNNPLFLGKNLIRKMANDNKIIVEHLLIEAEAQIDWFIDSVGFTPFFINGHQHCHIIPQFVEPLATLFAKKNIRYVRIPYEENSINPLCSVCSIVSQQSLLAKDIYNNYGIITNDIFLGLSFCGNKYSVEDIESYLNLEENKDKIVEIMVHPGYKDIINPWDSFSHSDDRESELKVLIDKNLKKFTVTDLKKLIQY